MARGPAFKQRLRVRANQITRNTRGAVQRIALAVDQAVVMATPVDTGRARSNWIVTVDVPFEGEIQPYSPGQRLGRGEGANAGAALEQGRAVITAAPVEHTIYITNNVRYIGDLNRGTSPQAGPYYVQAAMFEAVSMLKRIRLLKGAI